MGTPFSRDPNFAQAEPSLLLRSRLMKDLNVKGLVSCPDKIDLHAIIPVFNFSDLSGPAWGITRPIFNIDMGGTGGAFFGAIDFAVLLGEWTEVTLQYLYQEVRLDAAGRAALAAANDSIIFVLYEGGTPWGLNQIGQMAWNVAPFPLTGAWYQAGTHHYPLGGAGTLIPQADQSRWQDLVGLKLSKVAAAGGLFMGVQLGSGGNFPANSIVNCFCDYSYK
jgi:hypothetical protein